jgi:hypothetical protein
MLCRTTFAAPAHRANVVIQFDTIALANATRTNLSTGTKDRLGWLDFYQPKLSIIRRKL